jgi:hypothetical protein
MKEIKLTKGMVTIVDDDDYKWLSKFKWFSHKARHSYYASRSVLKNGKTTTIDMHREILGLQHRDGKISDHINRNGLDNRKENLRIVSMSENTMNHKLYCTNTSGYHGVSWDKNKNKWRASLHIKKNGKHVGYYSDPIEAAYAYDMAAKKYYGEYATLNFLETQLSLKL